MTDHDLSTMMRELSEELTAGDSPGVGVGRAWAEARRRRTRVRLTVVGSVAAAAVGVAAVAVLAPREPTPVPGPSTQSPSPSSRAASPSTPQVEQGPFAARAGVYGGAAVWWAPSAVDEAKLPHLPDAPLPAVIDLDAAAVGPVGEPAQALFAGHRHQGAFVLTASGRVVGLDVSRLARVADEAGNFRSPVSWHSLSGDGRRAFFIQESSLEVLDFVTGEWTTIDTPDWLAEGARWVMPDEIWVPSSLGEESGGTVYGLDGSSMPAQVDWVQGWAGEPGWDGPWGPVVLHEGNSAQAAFLGGPIDGGSMSNPQGLLVDMRGERHVLALDYGGPGQGTRPKGCCLALGWQDGDTVLFASASTEGQRILAWEVGTQHVHLVSEITGPGSIVAVAPQS